MLGRVVWRAAMIGYPVLVAIPDSESELGDYCQRRGWNWYAGAKDNVLKRYLGASRAVGAEHVIRVTADCPLLDVEAAKFTVWRHLQTDADFTYYYAEGRGVEVFKQSALEYALTKDLTMEEEEHVDEWFFSSNQCKVTQVRFSVDTQGDLDLMREWHQESEGA